MFSAPLEANLVPLEHLGDCITTAATSVAAGMVVVASAAGGVCVVNARDKREVARLDGAHRAGVLSVDIGPVSAAGEATIVTGGEDGMVRIWRLHSRAVATSPALKCSGELLMKATAGGAITSRSGVWVSRVSLDDSGAHVAVATGKAASVYRVADIVAGAVASAASGSKAGAPAVEPVMSLPPTAHPLDELKFVRGGRLLTACYGRVALWRLALGGAGGGGGGSARRAAPTAATELDYKGWPLATAMSPNGLWVASGCNDETVHMWQLSGKDAGAELTCGGYSSSPTVLAWSSDSALLATAGGAAVSVWRFAGAAGSPAGSTPVTCLPRGRGGGDVTAMAFHPTLPLLAVGATAGVITVYSVVTHVPAASLGVRLAEGGRRPAAFATPLLSIDVRDSDAAAGSVAGGVEVATAAAADDGADDEDEDEDEAEAEAEAEARGGPWRGDTALAVATLSWAAPDALVAGCCNGRLVIIKAAAPIA